MRDKKRLLLGIFFLALAGFALLGIITAGFKSYYVTVILISSVIGIGFLRQSRHYR